MTLVAKECAYLEQLEGGLQEEYARILKQGELLWLQKSQTKWWIEEENNTRYCHSITINRRGRNQILRLRNMVGEWTNNENELKCIARDFYKDLYTRPCSTL